MENTETSTEELVFTEEIRQLTTNDPGHADTFNPLFNQLLQNTRFVKKKIEDSADGMGKDLEDISKEVEDLREEVESIEIPVKFVNNKTGDETGNVILTASDVGASPTNHGHVYSEVSGMPETFPPSTHSHTKTEVGLSNVDNAKQMPIAGGTFTGAAVAQTNTSYGTRQLRNVIISTANPSGGSNGDIWVKYI